VRSRLAPYLELSNPFKSDTIRSCAMAPSPPRVFISYSHDSTEHKELVLRFAQRLRKDGVDAQIDQFVGGRPTEGWPRWMLDKLDWAEFVLLICTETYYRRFRGHEEPHRGRGVDWEGQLITLAIYNAKSHAAKFVPVIFGSKDREFIPEPLSDHVYCLDSEDSYQELYGFLTGQAGVPLPELGPAKQILRKDVEPLTFGAQGDKSPSTGKLDEVPDRLPRKLASGTDSTPRGKEGPPSKEDTSNQERRKQIGFYAVISLISFLCGVGILGLMVWKATLLSGLGLTGNLYYLVLLPVGLAAAGFLFGVLQSFARYRGEQLGGVLELGGPIVAFLLVVVLGFVLVKPVTTFPLTVYVHGEGGPQDLVLRNSGVVLMDLGPYRQPGPIGAEGQAYFPAIPPNFRGQEVLIGLESDAFELSNPKEKHRLDGSSLYVAVRKRAGHIYGRVQDDDGNPIPNAVIHVAGLPGVTDSAGHFELIISGDRLRPQMEIEIAATGYEPAHYTVVPNAEHVVLGLKKSH
jgi:SEFIR domain